MKGPTATAESRGGNDWDQAALLVQRLTDAGFDAEIVSGDVEIPLDEVQAWIGATDPTAVEPILEAAFGGNATQGWLNGKPSITFNHAWVQVTAPTSTGLDTIDLDPSWKFKNYQDGIDLNVDFDEFDFIAQAGTFFDDNDSKQGKELLARELPLEYFEGRLMDGIVADANLRGSSLADVPYDGPTDQQLFIEPPDWEYATSAPVEHGTLESILLDMQDSEDFTHRVRIALGTSPSTTVWDWEGSLAQYALSGIVIENRISGANFDSTLIVDGQDERISSPLSSATTYHLYVTFLSPGGTPYVIDTVVAPDETLAVALGVNQRQTKMEGLIKTI
jgi:hypothetical protein